MDTKEKEWIELLEEIDFTDSNISPDYKNLEEKIELNESFTTYFNDYCQISYLNDIKENQIYLLNKWKLIFFHCVQLDDFYFYLNNKNVNLLSNSCESLKTIKIGTKNNNKNKSFNSENKKQSIFDNSNSSGSLKGNKLINSSCIIDNTISEFSNSNENEIKVLNSFNKEKNDIRMNESSEIKLNEFKLIEAKKSLHIYDNEKIGGTEYELQCKRVLYLMLIFIGRDNYKIFNPHKIPIQKFINKLNIKEFENEKLTDSDAFEIDIIINDFKISDLKALIKEFSSHFLLTEKLRISEIDESTKVNFIGEISRNFIIQISNKSAQLKTYFASFKIIEKLNEQNFNLSEEEKDYIFKSFNLQKNNNMNIFFIITDGSYLILRFVIETILKIKKDNLSDENIKKFINEEIDKNKVLLNFLMSNKFKNLSNLTYKTYEALKYLDDKNIRYCIFYMGDKGENKYEDFYKEKEGKKSQILFQTKFSNEIHNLYNDLINSKEIIISKINEFGNKIRKNLIDNERLLDFISHKYPILSLSNYFKIHIHFYYIDNNIKIDLNDKYYIQTTFLDKDEKFKNIFKKLSQTQNLDTLFIFIDNKQLLDKNEENPFISIIPEFKVSNTYNLIGDYIKKNIKIFDTIFKKKIDNKIKKLEENKNIYTKKCELNLKIVIEKFKNDKDLNFEVENVVKLLCENCKENIEEVNNYADRLVNNAKSLENMINKTFKKDFKNTIINNFTNLSENIKSSIIYDYVVKKLIKRLIISKWDCSYNYNSL